jgi:molybdate transport system permease protein
MIHPAFGLSFALATLTTLLLLAVAVPLAYWLAFARGPWKPWIEALVALPMALPPTVLGFYLLGTMGSGGWAGQLWQSLFHHPLAFTFEGLVVASICYSLPFAVQPIQAAFSGLEPGLREAAWMLGASRSRTFWQVVAPNCLPGLVAGAVLAFTHTMGEFGVALMVGGNIPGETRTVSIALYDMVESLAYDEASRLAATLLALSYGVLLALYLYQRSAIGPWRRE